ncbi:cytochrome c-type biogenesis protein [Aliidiomarina sp. Khilg15.8]
MRLWILCCACWLGFGLAFTANANVANYEFETAAQERQFRQLINELRCPKCQNQTIAESDAPLALDLRQRVYEMTREGHSRDEILHYMRQRYGDFVHYKPPMNATTMVLWWGPALVLVIGVLTIVLMARRRRQDVSLSAAEQARLDALLNKPNDNKERED